MKRKQSNDDVLPKKKVKPSNLCQHEGCVSISPVFNLEGEVRGRFCAQHKLPNMVDVKNKRCEHVGCGKLSPVFNFEGKVGGRFCTQHKLPNMVNVKSRRCEHVGCTKINPTFNLEGEARGRFCTQHKLPIMVDVKSRRCEHVGCTKITPCFNYEGEVRGRFCAQHKLPIMVDVKHKRCDHVGCTKLNPSFNYEGESRGRFCAQHKLPTMVNVQSRCCEHVGCTLQPVFNLEGESRGWFCAQHKLPNMVNIQSRRCEHVGCTLQPSFNFEGESGGRFCAPHKLPTMVNVQTPRCVQCTKQPNSGIPGHRPTHCAEHRTNGMIANPLRRCEECKAFALYGMNSTPTHCETHKAPQHLNLVQHDCTVCRVLDYVDDEGKCANCSDYLKKKLHLRKQRQVKMWLNLNPRLKNYQYYDRQIEGGVCGKERPDFVWDCGTHWLILEIDERQHRTYRCEQKRMVKLTQTLGMPCLWVRYNPDEFKGQKASLKERDRRELLEKWLVECQTLTPQSSEDYCRVSYLFYDGFQVGHPITMEKIQIPTA